MSAEPPNLQRLWDWAQSPTEAALYERNKPAYLKSLRDFLESDDNATYGQWDKHCSVSNADLLPTSVRFPLPINIMETTELVNKGLKQCLFNEPTEPQKRKYALVYGEERRKNPKKRKLGSESEDSQSVSDDEELGSEFMEDVESDPEPPEGIDISMDLFRLRYGKVRFPPTNATGTHLQDKFSPAQVQRRFFFEHPDHENAKNLYWPWNRIPDDDILGTDHLEAGEWKTVSSSIPVKKRIENWYRTHREKPFVSDAMESMPLNKAYPFKKSRSTKEASSVQPKPLKNFERKALSSRNTPARQMRERSLSLIDILATPVGDDAQSERGTSDPHPTESAQGTVSEAVRENTIDDIPLSAPRQRDSRTMIQSRRSVTPPGGRNRLSLRGGDYDSSRSSDHSGWSTPDLGSISPFEIPDDFAELLGVNKTTEFASLVDYRIQRVVQYMFRRERRRKKPPKAKHEMLRHALQYPAAPRPYPTDMSKLSDICQYCRQRGSDMDRVDFEDHVKFGCPNLQSGYIGDPLDTSEAAWYSARKNDDEPEDKKIARSMAKLPPGAQYEINTQLAVFRIVLKELLQRKNAALDKGEVDKWSRAITAVEEKRRSVEKKLIEDARLAVAFGYVNKEADEAARKKAVRRRAKKTEEELDPTYVPGLSDSSESDYSSDSDSGRRKKKSRARRGTGNKKPASDSESSLTDVDSESDENRIAEDSDRDLPPSDLSDPEEFERMLKDIAKERKEQAKRAELLLDKPPPGYTAEAWAEKREENMKAKAAAEKAEAEERFQKRTGRWEKRVKRQRKEQAKKKVKREANKAIEAFMANFPEDIDDVNQLLQVATNLAETVVKDAEANRPPQFNEALRKSTGKKGSGKKLGQSTEATKKAAVEKAAAEKAAAEKAAAKKAADEKAADEIAAAEKAAAEKAAEHARIRRSRGKSAGDVDADFDPVKDGDADPADEVLPAEAGEVEHPSPPPSPVTPASTARIAEILWRPRVGAGHSNADDEANKDTKNYKEGWRVDGRICCPVCGKSISRLGEKNRLGHMDKHGASFGVFSDFLLHNQKHEKFINKLREYTDNIKPEKQLVTDPANTFTTGLITLHQQQATDVGEDPATDSGGDDDGGSGDGAGKGRSRSRGRGGKRGGRGAGGGKGGTRKSTRKTVYSKAKLAGAVPYDYNAIGGYDPPRQWTVPPEIQHAGHPDDPMYKGATGAYDPYAPRNWRFFRGESPWVETWDGTPPPPDPPAIMKPLSKEGSQFYQKILNFLGQKPKTDYAHHDLRFKRFYTQGQRIEMPLADQMEFSDLKFGVLKKEVEDALRYKGYPKNRLPDILEPPQRFNPMDLAPAEAVDFTALASAEWMVAPLVEHQVADKKNYWDRIGMLPGKGFKHPVQRFMAIKKDFPVPIRVWTQANGKVDTNWIDPEIVRECTDSCPPPPIPMPEGFRRDSSFESEEDTSQLSTEEEERSSESDEERSSDSDEERSSSFDEERSSSFDEESSSDYDREGSSESDQEGSFESDR